MTVTRYPLALYAMHNYVWKLCESILGMSVNDTGGKVPIMAGSEQPDFDEYNKPFMVYGWAIEGEASDVWAINTELVAYNIYSTSSATINTMLRMLNEAFRAKDVSASNVNRWINSSTNPNKSLYAGINFTTTAVVSISGPDNQDTEGGKYNAMIVIRYSYTQDSDLNSYRFG